MAVPRGYVFFVKKTMKHKSVLLTGITGFLGSHTAIQLLNRGYKVVGTLRNKERIDSIRAAIGQHVSNIDHLSFAEADLSDSAVWNELTKNMDYVQHIASPFPRRLPENENDLIAPAKNGTLNILKSAADNGVKRVVMTSSLAAVAYGKSKHELSRVFTENDWTDETNKSDTAPYIRSKTIAEKAAWAFLQQNKSAMELTTVLPGAILGPVLENDFGTSANIVVNILQGRAPALPKIGFDIVDVRSVADLQIRAMEMPNAAGNRYIASSGYLTFKEIALLLRAHYPDRKIPAGELPNFAARLFSVFEPSLKPVLLDLGIKRKTYIGKAKSELNWAPLPLKEAVTACAESLFQKKIIK